MDPYVLRYVSTPLQLPQHGVPEPCQIIEHPLEFFQVSLFYITELIRSRLRITESPADPRIWARVELCPVRQCTPMSGQCPPINTPPFSDPSFD